MHFAVLTDKQNLNAKATTYVLKKKIKPFHFSEEQNWKSEKERKQWQNVNLYGKYDFHLL